MVFRRFRLSPVSYTHLDVYKRQRQKRGELPKGEITFIMISGDGGMDIGLGSAIGAALRNDAFILMEYDNGGYMNTGYQLSLIHL